MKKILCLLTIISLNLVILCLSVNAQVSGVLKPAPKSTSSENTKTSKGIKELRKQEKRNKEAARREILRKKREERREARREQREARRDSRVYIRASRSTKGSRYQGNPSAHEPTSPRPSAGPVDLNGHKKTVNGHEVTVVEMEPKKN